MLPSLCCYSDETTKEKLSAAIYESGSRFFKGRAYDSVVDIVVEERFRPITDEAIR